jgi:glycosyltransferase involved in cell wall biosynthesis
MPSALFVTTVPVTLEAFLVPFADHFRAEGWRVDALSNGAAGDSRLDGHFDTRFDAAWSRNPLAPSNLLGTAQRVRGIVTAGGYDIVHVHTPVAAFVTRYALRSLRGRAGAPAVIYTAHGFHFYEGGAAGTNLLYRTLERAAARWTDFLVTINREDLAAAKGLRGIATDRVRYVPGIGVDTERFSPDAVSAAQAAVVRRGLNVPDDAFMLTMVAEFAPVKRHDHVLRALARVKDDSVVLVLVGDGPREPRLREKVAALGLTDRVRWAGYRRDLPAVLAASDATILASEREGLNRSVLEAMAAGRPVIGTRTRGIADAVGTEAGWIVPKDDIQALARAIETAAADPEDRERRGAAARRRAVSEFALPRIIEAYEELYREALASRV